MNDEILKKDSHDFIRSIIRSDFDAGKYDNIVTRFPPEPNGYLHIGHAKSICLNFGIAQEFNGRCYLRFDDTNPTKEEMEFIKSIQEDVRWLGFDWGEHLYYASDYFEQLYQWAEHLIKQDKAYVDDLTAEEMREYRGTLTQPGRNSPYRERSIKENLDLFRCMRAGKFPNGAKVLRAKIDMASNNINMRDPTMYRILHETHPRTGNEWCIYPTYDFTHGQSDAIEHITHSICTLEFEDHRPLYDWFINNLPVPSSPHQYEFAPLNLTYTVLSKRRLNRLVNEGYVKGWDDPRLLTISGLRRRGVPAEAIRDFIMRIGVSKSNATIDIALLDHCIRDYLNKRAERRMAVLNPLKVVIENYPKDKTEMLTAINNPEDKTAGLREIPFSRTLYIEYADFMEAPPKNFFRFAPGREVRLRYGYFITCTDVIKDETGKIIELRCTYDPASRGGSSSDGRKVKATLHWVSSPHAISAEVRLYDHLFLSQDPTSSASKDFSDDLNPTSLSVLKGAKVEPALANAHPGVSIQFERQGYFTADPDMTKTKLVFNRTISLRDSWIKVQKKINN